MSMNESSHAVASVLAGLFKAAGLGDGEVRTLPSGRACICGHCSDEDDDYVVIGELTEGEKALKVEADDYAKECEAKVDEYDRLMDQMAQLRRELNDMTVVLDNKRRAVWDTVKERFPAEADMMLETGDNYQLSMLRGDAERFGIAFTETPKDA